MILIFMRLEKTYLKSRKFKNVKANTEKVATPVAFGNVFNLHQN